MPTSSHNPIDSPVVVGSQAGMSFAEFSRAAYGAFGPRWEAWLVRLYPITQAKLDAMREGGVAPPEELARIIVSLARISRVFDLHTSVVACARGLILDGAPAPIVAAALEAVAAELLDEFAGDPSGTH